MSSLSVLHEDGIKTWLSQQIKKLKRCYYVQWACCKPVLMGDPSQKSKPRSNQELTKKNNQK